jgi:hypothetical protein
MAKMVNDCVVEPERLFPLQDCLDCGGPEDPTDEWDHNLIHPNTVAYSCGKLFIGDSPHEHNHDPEELSRCHRLAEECVNVLGDVQINLSEGFDNFKAFFITANHGMEAPTEITSEFINLIFGGTIYPQAEIIVEPFVEGNLCWHHFVVSNDPEETVKYLYDDDAVKEFWERQRYRIESWQKLFDWFNSRNEFHDCAFVMIGESDPPSETNFGCVFPRLVLGLTKQGSVTGMCSPAVHT